MMVIQDSFLDSGPAYFCRRCHRALSNPVSVQAGMGPICRGHGASGKESVVAQEFSDVFIDGVPLDEALLLGRSVFEDATVFTNVPHLVVAHSPDGYEFGYAGSGPADLALNVCEWYLKRAGYKGERTPCGTSDTCFSLAWVLHQLFKESFLVNVDKRGTRIEFALIDAWFVTHITDEFKSMYGGFDEALG